MKTLSVKFNPEALELIKSSLKILCQHSEIDLVKIDKANNVLYINVCEQTDNAQ